jgi:hypothetical protein
LGSDYLRTTAGTFYNFPGIGIVEFVGSPIISIPPVGQTDTIVERLDNAVVGGAPIPIQITALSLVSKYHVLVGGNLYDVAVTLDPANLALYTGTMTVGFTNPITNPILNGGTFTSTLTVYFLAQFTPISAGAPFSVPGMIVLTAGPGSQWKPCSFPLVSPPLVPPPCPPPPPPPLGTTFTVTSQVFPLDPLPLAQAADVHTGKDPLFEADFFPVIINEELKVSGVVQELHSVMTACANPLPGNPSPGVDLTGKSGLINPLFSGTPGSCPTNWVCGGSPAPGVASYTPGVAQYPSGAPFPTSSFSPTVLEGSGVARQNTSLKWVAGQTYYLNFYGGVPDTEPDGTTAVAGWPQTVRVYLTAGPGFAQVAAFDIPSPGKGNFVSKLLNFTLPSNSAFVGQSIGVLIFVNASPNGFSANVDIGSAPCM